jgi:hypothetical protein
MHALHVYVGLSARVEAPRSSERMRAWAIFYAPLSTRSATEIESLCYAVQRRHTMNVPFGSR